MLLRARADRLGLLKASRNFSLTSPVSSTRLQAWTAQEHTSSPPPHPLLSHTCDEYLAYDLKDGNDAPEVPNVEHGQLKLDVAIVTSTVGQVLPTRLTHSILGTGTLVGEEATSRDMSHDLIL